MWAIPFQRVQLPPFPTFCQFLILQVLRLSALLKIGHIAEPFLVPVLILSNVCRFWFFTRGSTTLFRILPSTSEIYHDIPRNYPLCVSFVANCTFFSSHLPCPLVDVAQITSIDPLALYSRPSLPMLFMRKAVHRVFLSFPAVLLAAHCCLPSAYS